MDSDSCVPTSSTVCGPSWTVSILPYIEEQALYDRFDLESPFRAMVSDHDTDTEPYNTPVPIFKCPSERANLDSDPSLNYMGVQGGGIQVEAKCLTGTTPANRRAGFQNGILYRNSNVRMAKITDGTSKTFLVGESRWWLYEHTNVGFVHWMSWASADRADSINSHTIVTAAAVDPINNPLVDYDSAQPWVDVNGPTNTLYLGTHTRCFGSRHPGGCHFAFADGSVNFILDTVDLRAYQLTGVRDDGEAREVRQ